jgi:hypothetical protein
VDVLHDSLFPTLISCEVVNVPPRGCRQSWSGTEFDDDAVQSYRDTRSRQFESFETYDRVYLQSRLAKLAEYVI